MRHFGMANWCKAAAFMAVMALFSSSCKEDDPVLPDYVGTWVTVETIPSETGYVQFKDVMTFTESGFTDMGQMQLSANKWMDFVSMKGTMSVYGDMMSVTVTEIGMSSFSMVTGLPTGVITAYKKGTPEFETLLEQMEQSKNFESKYSVSGNKLTLQTDLNEDGDYLDEMEISVYTKQ